MSAILTIGGTDSSGGAGLTRDAQVARDLGLTPRPVVTAVTAQTDAGVIAIHPVPPAMIAEQIAAALATGPVGAVKIGMLGSLEAAEAVAQALADCPAPRVLDPVLKASSGGALGGPEMLRPLLPGLTLLTPNLAEAAELSGGAEAQNDTHREMQGAGILGLGVQAVLIKGGHGAGDESIDYLYGVGDPRSYAAPRLKRGRRGTGCSLATAIACHLARGESLPISCGAARRYVQRWLQEAQSR
ncbi:hydroxymethylpyrimidine/phosphomethylpyrimidine kinase [Roseovarius nubinhibens]|uniref:bifunctional hydroxymethylpyrimidine kinase/phosphomethylpyrimidine kinase n=1 Tax=Roseovarius nubinhibens TaxID=314263 RepID=UPI001C09F581|nr:hydroxymethylpyrimidine/phosphomethylpyrimidine kinase [Roseovarius nubinhibens]MBU2998604.1 hydroxymethylpyrimidine/phosphomethylpyrimidine kinase [Roseovarius nubinhibens]